MKRTLQLSISGETDGLAKALEVFYVSYINELSEEFLFMISGTNNNQHTSSEVRV